MVFALGLSATVAPLTATVLDSVDEGHTGIASGINNGVARTAGLLAIAVLGAVISSQFASALDERVGPAEAQAPAVSRAKEKPLGSPASAGAGSEPVATAITDASVSAFHLGMGIAGGLMIAGGLLAGVGIRNPERHEAYAAPRAAPAGDCGHLVESEPSGLAGAAELA
jgi:hypothetical protein